MFKQVLKFTLVCAVVAGVSGAARAFDLKCCEGDNGSIPATEDDAARLNKLRIKKCDTKSAFFKRAILSGKIKIIESGVCPDGWADKYSQATDKKRYNTLNALNAAGAAGAAKK